MLLQFVTGKCSYEEYWTQKKDYPSQNKIQRDRTWTVLMDHKTQLYYIYERIGFKTNKQKIKSFEYSPQNNTPMYVLWSNDNYLTVTCAVLVLGGWLLWQMRLTLQSLQVRTPLRYE